jgi:hypothetical protein
VQLTRAKPDARTRSGAVVPGPGRRGAVTYPVRPLAAAPLAGPIVSAPVSAGELPVSSGTALPPGAVPDGYGVVLHPPRSAVISPSRTTRPRQDRQRLAAIGDSAAGTPRQRWETAVSARPLEAPRSLPPPFHALARAITGRPRPPQYTTGPATRGALAAAGALGATTGTVVHLPRPPVTSVDAAVLAHELTHTRSPVRRPRFLLSGASALLDDDERQALAAGRRPAGVAAAEPVGAGIVDQLPVGGGMGAVAEVAVRAAKAAVIEAGAAPLSAMPDAATSWTAGATESGFGGSLAGTASGPAGVAAAGSRAPGGPDRVGPSGTTGQPAGAGGAPGGGVVAANLDPDRVMEIIEERLVREIERRGGRWAGVF